MKIIILFFLLIVFYSGVAQTKTDIGSLYNTIYVLPDGTNLPEGKLDSLTRSWGAGKIGLIHSYEDDVKGLVHLVRIKDILSNTYESQTEKNDFQLNSLKGKLAPDFTVRDMNHKKWKLSALKGKVVVINFWFTTCPPCLQEIPELNEIKAKSDTSKVVFLALTFNEKEVVEKFLLRKEFNLNVLPDARNIIDQYHIILFPTTFLIGKEGIIKNHYHFTPHYNTQLQEGINNALL